MTYKGLACFPARRWAPCLPEASLRRHFRESLRSESCTPKLMELALETGSLAVTLLRHFESLFLSPSIKMLMALPTLGIQWAGEFNCERRGSVLLHWSSRTTNTKSTSKHLRHQHSREGGVSHDAVKNNKSKMLFIYLSDARSTSASNALQIIGRSVQLPRKCILVWGKAGQDNKFCGSRKSQELTNVFGSEGRRVKAMLL